MELNFDLHKQFKKITVNDFTLPIYSHSWAYSYLLRKQQRVIEIHGILKKIIMSFHLQEKNLRGL